jgi:K(+)-stimulated pyrophosphate-energized sodium pump
MIELALILAISVLALAFAASLGRWLVARPIGDGDAPKVGAAVRGAAEAFFRRQSSTIGALCAALGAGVFLAYGLVRRAAEALPVPALELGVWLTVSLALGAASSLATGRTALWAATHANERAAAAARRSLDLALQVGLRGGAVAGLASVALGILGAAGLFVVVLAYKGGLGGDLAGALRVAPSIPVLVAGYALGAAFAGLLAQLGGGAYAKAADVGADLAARDLGLEEDDPENPAATIDLAGDAVGGAAADSTTMFAATAVETLGAMLVGGVVFRENPSLPSALAFLLFPLVARALGLLGSAFGVMVVRTDDREEPLNALGRGLHVSALLASVGLAGASKWLLGPAWPRFFACGLAGVVLGVVLFHLARYATEQGRQPARELAEAARGGTALTLLHGSAGALGAALLGLVAASTTVIAASSLGARTGLVGGGLYGVAVAAMGLLATAPYVLSMGTLGAILDGASGVVVMSFGRDRPDVRGRAMVLDAVGNTARAHSRAYLVGAALVGALPLVGGFVLEARRRAGPVLAALNAPAAAPSAAPVASAAVPAASAVAPSAPHADLAAAVGATPGLAVYVGGFLGLLLVVWFSVRCLAAVSRTARRVLDEAVRQIEARRLRDGRLGPDSGAVRAAPSRPPASVGRPILGPPGALTGDQAACAEIVARSALREMVLPAIAAAAAPLAFGLALRFARSEDNPLAVADSVAALIVAGTIAGVIGSLFLGNAGGAWDNAKKYIATGAHGGRYLVDEGGARADNPTYLAAANADSVGDPLKDLLGPALVVFVMTLSVVTLVLLPFFL